MSLYRCAACGSPNVVKHEEKDGFSYKKAIAGTVVFGAIGAVAGIDGKTTYVYSCPDCGATLSHPMDDITKGKIDNVMIDPDFIMPIMFPDMCQRYPALKKECELKRSARNAGMSNSISPDSKNPLNVSEEEFRQSAKDVAEAIYLITQYINYYDKHEQLPDFAGGEVFSGYGEKTHKADIRDAEFIRQSLGKMKNVVYALSCYDHLIHDAEDLNTGLSRKELMDLLYFYVMMEQQDTTIEKLYNVINDNSMLKQAFMLVMPEGEYVKTVEESKKYSKSFREEQLIKSWYKQFKVHTLQWRSIISYMDPKSRLFDRRDLQADSSARTGGFASPLRCRISVFDNKLHILHRTYCRYSGVPKDKAEIWEDMSKKLESKMEELAHNEELLKQLENDAPSTSELDITQRIQSLETEYSTNQSSIQKLQKVTFFGKKKAQAEANALIAENEKLISQIETLKKELKTQELERKKNNKRMKDEIEYKQKDLKDDLEEMKIECAEIVQDIHWVPVE